MQVIRELCEMLKAFFTKKATLVTPIIDDSKVMDENTDDLKFTVPPTPTDLDVVTPPSSSEVANPLSLELKKHLPSVPTQMPTALEFLAQQRLVDMATGIDRPHLDENKSEEKQDVKPVVSLAPSPSQEDLD